MKKVLFIAIAIMSLSLVSCEGTEPPKLDESGKPIVEAEITIFYPDGTKETIEVFDVRSGSNNVRIFYNTMDGTQYSTTLPVTVKYK